MKAFDSGSGRHAQNSKQMLSKVGTKWAENGPALKGEQIGILL